MELGAASPMLGASLSQSHHQQSLVTETSSSRLLAQSHEALAIRNAELTQTMRERQQELERMLQAKSLLEREKHTLQLSLADAEARAKDEAERNSKKLRVVSQQLNEKDDEMLTLSKELDKLRRELSASRSAKSSEAAELTEELAVAHAQIRSQSEENLQLQELLKQMEAIAADAQARSNDGLASTATANAELLQGFESQGLVVEQLLDEKKELERLLAKQAAAHAAEQTRWSEELIMAQNDTRAVQREMDELRTQFEAQLEQQAKALQAERFRHAAVENEWEARVAELQAQVEQAHRALPDSEARLQSELSRMQATLRQTIADKDAELATLRAELQAEQQAAQSASEAAALARMANDNADAAALTAAEAARQLALQHAEAATARHIDSIRAQCDKQVSRGAATGTPGQRGGAFA